MSVSSSSGSSSTLDTYIQQILAVERQPARDLEKLRSNVSQKLGVLTDIGSVLTALRSALSGFKNTGSQSALHLFSVTTSKSDVLVATATSDAVPGDHTIRVANLARAHSLASGGFVGATTGAFAAGTNSFSVTVGGDTKTVSVAFDGTETNTQALTKVTNALNQAGAGLSATLVTSDPATGTQKIVLTSKKTGTTNLISSISDTTGTLAAQLGIAGTSSTGAYHAATAQSALDASFTLDGLALKSDSNNVTTAVRGVTLNLLGTSPDTDVALKITADTEQGQKKVEEFITKFNAVIDILRSKTATASNFKDRAILAGSSSFLQLLNDTRSASSLGVSGLASGSLNRLADLGITADRDGKLSLTDATKLKSALADKQSQVEDVFGSTNGIGAKLDKILNNFLGSTGVLEQERTLLNSQDKQLKVRIGRIDGQLSIREKGLRVQYTQLLQLQAQLTTQQTSAGLF